ncbi:hypothetical protein B5E92_12365 [Erysipelatoclostridium sp. An15]|uniref:glycosyltransferase n=1 Tax=Erysipelatoclostridium sp. An15 TaxID=1965566 RepID=UPI000B39F3D8|nr:glycosyltransferase [Erysipelatoclostridium sp. An15]OUQ05203.1 hypothetical protein B5E92_12365 [Erysipelatoclostridium sp. An15]
MKIMIISHNCTNSLTNMGLTIKSIIKNISNVQVCQLYIKSSFPDENVCTSWFLLSDNMVLRNIVYRKNIGKKVAFDEVNSYKNKIIREKSQTKNINTKENILLFRDIIWKIGKWKTDSLKNWVKKENPEILIVFPGQSLFIYSITKYISKMQNIPAVFFYTDDYYYYQPKTKSFFYKVQHNRIKKKMNKYLSENANIVTITDLMRDDYKSLFPSANTISYLSVPTLIKEKKMQEEYDFVYLGNLSLGRWKTLIEIGKVLDDLNGKYKLDIFSGCDDQEIINNFKFINSIKFHGYVNSSKVSKIVSKSKVALHVEDITGEYIDRVKYTFSTKIADILNSDTCLMVVAPRDIALTEYCINNDCAYVITDKNNLKDRIIKIMVNDELRNSYVLKADEIVKKNHNAYINGKKLEKYLNDIINKEGVV